MISKVFTIKLLLLSSLSFVLATPIGGILETAVALQKREDINNTEDALLLARETESIYARLLDDALEPRESAGLRWGPHDVGNLKLYLTNPHEGFAGPKFPWANHVNFHVDEKRKKPQKDKPVVNMHIVKYHRGGTFCLYAWDSVKSKVVFDKCFDSFIPAIKECVEAVKGFVDDLLKAASFIAAVAIIAVLVVVLVSALTAMVAVA